MTHQVTGTVAELTTRNLISKAGKAFTKHGVRLDDGRAFELDGFKQRYTVGDRVVSVGVAIKYKVWTETGAYAVGAPEMPGVVSTPTSAPPAPYTAAKAGYAGGGGSRDVGFPIPRDSYQMSIIRQNALTTAANLVNAAYGASGCIESEIENDVTARAGVAIKVAYRLAAFSSGHLDEIMAEEMAREIKGMVAKGATKGAE